LAPRGRYWFLFHAPFTKVDMHRSGIRPPPTGTDEMYTTHGQDICSTTGPPMCQGATAGTSAAPGDAAAVGGWRRQRRWWPTGRRSGDRDDGAFPLPGPGHRRSVPDPPRRGTWAPRGAGLARPRGRWRAREGAAGDGRPGATRRVQRVARGTVTPPRL